jgi:hypothetical protein
MPTLQAQSGGIAVVMTNLMPLLYRYQAFAADMHWCAHAIGSQHTKLHDAAYRTHMVLLLGSTLRRIDACQSSKC